MCIAKWYKNLIKKMEWCDIGLIKLSAMAFALMVAKLWDPLLSLDWYWYGLIFLLAAIKPLAKALK
jgi:hypothetical protein